MLLDLAHVADEAEERERRWWHRAGGQLGGVEPLALGQERRPVELQPAFEHLPLPRHLHGRGLGLGVGHGAIVAHRSPGCTFEAVSKVGGRRRR